jgi:hypothetical protein
MASDEEIRAGSHVAAAGQNQLFFRIPESPVDEAFRTTPATGGGNTARLQYALQHMPAVFLITS